MGRAYSGLCVEEHLEIEHHTRYRMMWIEPSLHNPREYIENPRVIEITAMYNIIGHLTKISQILK